MPPGDVVSIESIPFLDKKQLTGGRFICTLMFFDGSWHSYAPTSETGKVVQVHMWPAEGMYFGRGAESPHDLSLRLLQLLSQQANFDYLHMHFAAISDDIFNLSASLYKLELIHRDQHVGVSRLAATEIESILITCRSVYDHLQEIVRKLWAQTLLHDTSVKKKELPPSFAGIALKGYEIRRAIDIASTYGLPFDVAAIYERSAPMFLRIRKFRDHLIHYGHPVEHIHNRADGFFVLKQLGPFKGLDIWAPEELQPNGFAPLMPILAQVIHGTMYACEEFARALASLISMPKPIAPEMTFYLRGYYNEYLGRALADAEARRGRGRYLLPVADGGSESP